MISSVEPSLRSFLVKFAQKHEDTRMNEVFGLVITSLYTPNANMADNSVVARDES